MAPRVYRNLDEIFAGEYEGMTYDEIKATFPNEAKMRAMDKIGYRYPRGESYLDLLSRLDPLVSERVASYGKPRAPSATLSRQPALRPIPAVAAPHLKLLDNRLQSSHRPPHPPPQRLGSHSPNFPLTPFRSTSSSRTTSPSSSWRTRRCCD